MSDVSTFTSSGARMKSERENELWRLAREKARIEETHPTEIDARTLVYYWKMKQSDAAERSEK